MLKVMMAAALLLPIALFTYASAVAYRNIHTLADERLDHSLEVLHEQAVNILKSAQFAIAVAEETIEGLSDQDIQQQEQVLHRRFEKIDTANDMIESLWVLDRNGKPLVTSYLYPVPGQINLADRDYFRAHIDKNVGVYVGGMITPRVRPASGVFSISRRRTTANGAFDGVIMAAISPEEFRKFYADLSHGAETYYALIRQDGTFLARFPARNGQLNPNTGFRDAIAKSPQSGKFVAVSPLDGIQRRIAYRKLAGYPLYVLAGTQTSALADELIATMSVHLIFGIPATLLLLGITALTIHRTRRLAEESARREMAEEALRQSQKMEAIGQLTGGVAHDFNNLLTIIIGNLDLAERQVKAGAAKTVSRLENYIKNAMQGARRAASLTQRLLAFSRRQPLEPKPIRADKLVRGMEDILRQSLGEAYQVETVGAGGLWMIEADPVQLESAILNLALNARDAMPDRGKITIETSNAFLDENYVRQHAGLAPGQYVQIAVSDTGSGMDAETIKQAFEPFFTTKPSGQGTGLGLSQIYGYVKQSGGHVKIYSEPGEGTTVKIYLPRLLDETKETSLQETGVSGTSTGEIILVVEDDEEVRTYVAEILRDLGYRVFHVGDAEAALELVHRENGRIDLILTDVVLPNKNGRMLADEATTSYPAIRILFMTGYSRNAIVHQGRLDPGVALIQKPLTQADLAMKVREVLTGKSAAAAK